MTLASPLVTTEEMEEVDCGEAEARRIMHENGRALRNPRNRRWLRDQKRRGCPLRARSNAKLVKQIESDLHGISHDFAVMLSRIYRVLDSQAFDAAISLFRD